MIEEYTIDWDTVEFDESNLVEFQGELELDEEHDRAPLNPIYLVINERNLGGYDIWLNDQFNCAGGRKLNEIGMSTLKEAREFCENWKYKKARDMYCVNIRKTDAEGNKVFIPMPNYTYEELMNKNAIRRYEVVEYVSPTVKFPERNKWVPEPKVIPELNNKSKEYHKTKFFKWYLGACKINMRADKFMKVMAGKLERKCSRQLALQIVDAIEKLSNAAKKNEEMQAIIKRNFGTTEFPKLVDAIRIPSQGKNYR